MTIAHRKLLVVALLTGCGLLAVLHSKAQQPNSESPLAPAETVSAPPTPVFWAESNPEQAEKIRRALGGPLTSRGLEFKGAPLSKVVEFLRDEYGIEILMDLQAMDDLGLSPDEPIDVNLRGISLGAGLRILLAQLELVYVVHDEMLMFTTEEEALTHEITAVYPVGDLLQQADGMEYNPPATGEDLIDVIVTTVAVDSWHPSGTSPALRPMQPGMLVVTATQDVHDKIGQLLAALRRTKTHKFAVPFNEPLRPKNRLSGRGGFGGGGTVGESQPAESE